MVEIFKGLKSKLYVLYVFCDVYWFKSNYKIWIMETSPNSSTVGSSIPGVIPWAFTYPRMRCLHATNYERILDVIRIYSLNVTFGT
uniref:Uncharacterized protein n=1 Tax=Lactuca sativa TaxID=4236 RepID=A0A9R1XPF7_LACSA|nr:hypothetical protein LSAT_V11C200099510 [Lactuca sativa]